MIRKMGDFSVTQRTKDSFFNSNIKKEVRENMLEIFAKGI